MTINVSQQRETGQPFTVADLHQFVDHANRQGLPDDTLVLCTASRGGSVFDLSTCFTGDPDTSAAHVTPKPGEVDEASRTTIRQSSTGPSRTYRHWLRSRTVDDLVLGDVRALLAKIYEAGLPADRYEITALAAPGTRRQGVRHLSARPGQQDG